MAKIKREKAKKEIGEYRSSEFFAFNPKPTEYLRDDDGPFASHSIEKKKKKKQTKNQTEKEKKTKKEGEEKEEGKACYLPGQKFDQPDERDPLRIFFEVLYQQLPDCELAAKWMMERGLLPTEEAKKVSEKQLGENQQQEGGPPAEALSHKKTSYASSRKDDKSFSNAVMKSKKRKVSENTSDGDLTLAKQNRKKKHKISSS